MIPMIVMSHGNPIALAIAPPAEGPSGKSGLDKALSKHLVEGRELLARVLWKYLLRSKVALTYGVAHTKSYISNGVHAAVDRHMAQVDQIAHDGHHRGIHHPYRQSGNMVCTYQCVRKWPE